MARAFRELDESEEKKEDDLSVQFTQWTELGNGQAYTASGKTLKKLPPGFYDLSVSNGAILWVPVHSRTDRLLQFPDSAVSEVVDEIEKFWEKEDDFIAHGLPYKRGILLWGPAGSGKSCTLQLLARQVVDKGGVVVMFGDSGTFVGGMRQLREVQPDTPVVVLMEDIDAIIERQNESKILNLLDGVELVHKCVFVSTTNFPEKLGTRIINRPSRFDRRFKIPHPAAASRRMYLETLVREGDNVDVEKMIKDSEGMSLAHLKELFVATVILGTDYSYVVETLQGMKEKAHSANETSEFDEIRIGQYA